MPAGHMPGHQRRRQPGHNRDDGTQAGTPTGPRRSSRDTRRRHHGNRNMMIAPGSWAEHNKRLCVCHAREVCGDCMFWEHLACIRRAIHQAGHWQYGLLMRARTHTHHLRTHAHNIITRTCALSTRNRNDSAQRQRLGGSAGAWAGALALRKASMPGAWPACVDTSLALLVGRAPGRSENREWTKAR